MDLQRHPPLLETGAIGPQRPIVTKQGRNLMPLLTRRASLAAVCAALITSVLVSVSPARAESNGGVRVMPLGDSITDGLNVPGGYRIGLWQKAVAAGYKVDFVGSLFNGPSSLGDHDHEGHSGWTISQIDANVSGWLRTSTPRTVLLHIGTNDMYGDTSGAPSRLGTLLDHITAAAPNADVFVATIITSTGRDGVIRAFNAAVPGLVQARANAGKHVHLVDMYSALSTSDLADGIHPNAGGYQKMANVWFNALQAVPGTIGNAGGTGSQSNVEVVGAPSGRCVDVPNSVTTNGTQVQLYDCSGGSNQRWTYTSSKQLQVYGTKCLDASGHGTTNGTTVIIWDCSGQANQQWNVNSNGTITGVQSGLCLDANAKATANGTKLVLWSCNGGTNQQWSLRT
jgi:lysophospholipase L1-like esterase